MYQITCVRDSRGHLLKLPHTAKGFRTCAYIRVSWGSNCVRAFFVQMRRSATLTGSLDSPLAALSSEVAEREAALTKQLAAAEARASSAAAQRDAIQVRPQVAFTVTIYRPHSMSVVHTLSNYGSWQQRKHARQVQQHSVMPFRCDLKFACSFQCGLAVCIPAWVAVIEVGDLIPHLYVPTSSCFGCVVACHCAWCWRDTIYFHVRITHYCAKCALER